MNEAPNTLESETPPHTLGGGEGETPAPAAEKPAQPRFLAEADYSANFKDVVVELRSGATQVWRVRGMGAFELQKFSSVVGLAGELEKRLLKQCLPAGTPVGEMDKLVPQSAVAVTQTAFALCYGERIAQQLFGASRTVLDLLSVIANTAKPNA